MCHVYAVVLSQEHIFCPPHLVNITNIYWNSIRKLSSSCLKFYQEIHFHTDIISLLKGIDTCKIWYPLLYQKQFKKDSTNSFIRSVPKKKLNQSIRLFIHDKPCHNYYTSPFNNQPYVPEGFVLCSPCLTWHYILKAVFKYRINREAWETTT